MKRHRRMDDFVTQEEGKEQKPADQFRAEILEACLVSANILHGPCNFSLTGFSPDDDILDVMELGWLCWVP